MKRITLTYLLFIFVTTFVSCSKKEVTVNDQTTVLVNALNIEDPDKNIQDLYAGVKVENVIKTPEGELGQLISTPELDLLTSIDLHGNISKSTSNKIAALPNNSIISLPSTHYYRLIICSEDFNTIYYNEALQNSSSPSIMLESGKTYKWFAYTVSSPTLASLPTLNNGKLSRASIRTRDLSFAQGTLTPIRHQKNYLNITLRKMTARFKININTRGLMGEFDYDDNQKAKVIIGTWDGSTFRENIVKYGDFTVLSNNPGYGTLTQEPSTYTNDIATDGNEYPAANKYVYIYTAALDDIPANQLAVKILDLKIKHHDGNAKRVLVPRNNHLIIPFNNTIALPLQKALTYDITARLIESALTVGSTKWARTNLFYNPSKQIDKYSFRYDNQYTLPKSEEYWYPGASTPDDPNLPSPLISACNRVYPAGMWREPTATQIQALINVNGVLRNEVLNLDGETKYATHIPASSPINPVYGNTNTLILPYFGYYNSNSINSPTEGHYWSLNGSSTYQYLKINSTSEQFVSTNVNYNERRLIRCVRTR